MTVGGCDSEALSGEIRAGRFNDPVAFNLAPDLERLNFGFLLLTADVGDHVIDHLGPGLKGLACAGDRLIGAYEHVLDLVACLIQREKSGHIALKRAVGFDGDEASLCAEALPLSGYDSGMLGVQLGYYHRHIGGVAVGAVVGDNGALRLGICLLESLYLILLHINGAENEVDCRRHFVDILCGIHYNDVSHVCGDGRSHAPFCADCFFICLAGRAGACGKGDYLKPRVILKQGGEALTDHSRCSDYADSVLFHNS